MNEQTTKDAMSNPELKYKMIAKILLNLELEGKKIKKILLDREIPVIVLLEPMEFFDIEKGDYRGFDFNTHKVIWRFK